MSNSGTPSIHFSSGSLSRLLRSFVAARSVLAQSSEHADQFIRTPNVGRFLIGPDPSISSLLSSAPSQQQQQSSSSSSSSSSATFVTAFPVALDCSQSAFSDARPATVPLNGSGSKPGSDSGSPGDVVSAISISQAAMTAVQTHGFPSLTWPFAVVGFGFIAPEDAFQRWQNPDSILSLVRSLEIAFPPSISASSWLQYVLIIRENVDLSAPTKDDFIVAKLNPSSDGDVNRKIDAVSISINEDSSSVPINKQQPQQHSDQRWVSFRVPSLQVDIPVPSNSVSDIATQIVTHLGLEHSFLVRPNRHNNPSHRSAKQSSSVSSSTSFASSASSFSALPSSVGGLSASNGWGTTNDDDADEGVDDTSDNDDDGDDDSNDDEDDTNDSDSDTLGFLQSESLNTISISSALNGFSSTAGLESLIDSLTNTTLTGTDSTQKRSGAKPVNNESTWLANAMQSVLRAAAVVVEPAVEVVDRQLKQCRRQAQRWNRLLGDLAAGSVNESAGFGAKNKSGIVLFQSVAPEFFAENFRYLELTILRRSGGGGSDSLSPSPLGVSVQTTNNQSKRIVVQLDVVFHVPAHQLNVQCLCLNLIQAILRQALDCARFLSTSAILSSPKPPRTVGSVWFSLLSHGIVPPFVGLWFVDAVSGGPKSGIQFLTPPPPTQQSAQQSSATENDQFRKSRSTLRSLIGRPSLTSPMRVLDSAFHHGILSSSPPSSSSPSANPLTTTDYNPLSRLLNVHWTVPASSSHSPIPALASLVPRGSTFTVRGRYAYFHYMQDRFDDKGWGCAYRSFQTIFSWFIFQGYTAKSVPSHRDIQTHLKRIDPSKPNNFIGSRQWIGSIDIQYLLMDVLDVSSRILSVNSGTELASRARELAYHFETQGTPIMIGGGALAFTILGVDYNPLSGQVAYLILDPHYVGDDDPDTIVKKGFCNWKGPDFFSANNFYNCCLPLCPDV